MSVAVARAARRCRDPSLLTRLLSSTASPPPTPTPPPPTLLHGKYLPSARAHAVPPRPRVRDAVVVGGGHNGLVCAAYLAKAGTFSLCPPPRQAHAHSRSLHPPRRRPSACRAGMDVLVLERRALLGGASVTEELHPGFHYSRGAYLAGLLRPQVHTASI